MEEIKPNEAINIVDKYFEEADLNTKKLTMLVKGNKTYLRVTVEPIKKPWMVRIVQIKGTLLVSSQLDLASKIEAISKLNITP